MTVKPCFLSVALGIAAALGSAFLLFPGKAKGETTNIAFELSRQEEADVLGELTTGELEIQKNEDYELANILITNEELFAMGFDFGDSVNVDFDNGKSFQDVPY